MTSRVQSNTEMEEKSNAKANPIGNNESLMTEDPEQPSGSKEGSQSSEAEEEHISEAFHRLEEKLNDMERRIAHARKVKRRLFVRLLCLILDLLQAKLYLQNT